MRETSAVGLQFRRGTAYGGGLPKVEPKELVQIPAAVVLENIYGCIRIKRQEKLFA